MKILVSTKALARTLDQIPEGEYVERVNMNEGEIVFIAQTKVVRMFVEIMQFEVSLEQTNRRWDWVHKLMKQVDDQPVSIAIHKGIINILFQY